jgi:hypothetical protein
VSVIPLMGSDNAVKAYIGSGLAFLSTIYFREMSPYRVEFTNFIAVIAQYVILAGFMAALLIDSDSLDSYGVSNFVLGCILLALNLTIIILAAYLAWLRYREARQEEADLKAEALKIEYAAEFSKNKFQTTLDYVASRAVPLSHELCYYYTSLMQAHDSINLSMIPATIEENGIIVSLVAPMDMHSSHPSLRYMNDLAQSLEAVICLSLPRAYLSKLRMHDGSDGAEDLAGTEHLRIISKDVFDMMGTYIPPAHRLHKKRTFKRTTHSDSRSSFNHMGLHSHSHHHHQASLSKPSSSEQVKKLSSVHDGTPQKQEAVEHVEGNQPKLGVVSIEKVSDEASSIDINESMDLNHLSMFGETMHHPKKTSLSALHHQSFVSLSNMLRMQISSCALRAYQLKSDKECSAGHILLTTSLMASNNSSYNYDACEIIEVKSCLQFTNQMALIRKLCAIEGTIPLYHYTNESVAPFIFEKGLRMRDNKSDGGIHFSTMGPLSYGIGSADYEEKVLLDCFGEGKLKALRGTHNIDIVFVYGINPNCIEQSPGGPDTSKMVSRHLFELFGTPVHHYYHLRPDHIKGCFLIDGTRGNFFTDLELDSKDVSDAIAKCKADDVIVHNLVNSVTSITPSSQGPSINRRKSTRSTGDVRGQSTTIISGVETV